MATVSIALIRKSRAASIVGIDINPAYIAVASDRYQQRLPGLELIVADLQEHEVSVAPVDLVFAALLFEYVDADAALKSVSGLLKPDGRLVTVVQLPKADGPNVTPSPFTSLQSLSPSMQLVSPESLRERAAAHGFAEVDSERVTSAGGKIFQVQTFAAAQPERPMSAT